MTKIEEVGNAIAYTDGWREPFNMHLLQREVYDNRARAAIEAMRVPTEDMVFAGHAPLETSVWLSNGEPYFEAEGPFHTFNAMIDAALGEAE